MSPRPDLDFFRGLIFALAISSPIYILIYFIFFA